MTLSIYNGDGTLVAGSEMVLKGPQMQGLKLLQPPLEMQAESTWKVRVNFVGSAPEYYPKGLTFTYLNRFANGPIYPTYRSGRFTEAGVGFDVVGETRIQ
jgi:hypothetical protein